MQPFTSRRLLLWYYPLWVLMRRPLCPLLVNSFNSYIDNKLLMKLTLSGIDQPASNRCYQHRCGLVCSRLLDVFANLQICKIIDLPICRFTKHGYTNYIIRHQLHQAQISTRGRIEGPPTCRNPRLAPPLPAAALRELPTRLCLRSPLNSGINKNFCRKICLFQNFHYLCSQKRA